MTWKVPLADIDLDEAEIRAVENVLRSKWLTMGAITQTFETAFANFVGTKHAIAVANCTVALHLAYEALGLGPGDEVILPSLTFVATANAVLYTGATPVFAEIGRLDDLTISPADIEAKITPKTRAICVMHYGGYPCAMDEILEIAKRHQLPVIEDAAHAPGAEFQGKKCGSIGDIGCFSFFSNKNLAVGEGGMITTNHDDLAEQVRLMRSHGMTSLTWDRHRGHAHSYDVVKLGYNYRLDEIRAAIGLEQLKKLPANNQRRREITAQYHHDLGEMSEITIPFMSAHGQSASHIMPILLDETQNRSKFVEDMKARGIQTSGHYPPIHLFSDYQNRFGYQAGLLPLTESVGRRVVTLPLHPLMSDEDVILVSEAVQSIVQGN